MKVRGNSKPPLKDIGTDAAWLWSSGPDGRSPSNRSE